MEIINSTPEIASAFSEYLKQDNSKRECAVPTTRIKKDAGACNSRKSDKQSMMVSPEKTQELQELVDEFVKDPTSFLEQMQLKQFIDNLPYGSVEDNTLNAMIDRLQDVSPGMALVLLKYSVEQTLYFQ